jgi:hypothetical protein
MPPAQTIYIASCRLSRPFGGKFRGKDAVAFAFSGLAMIERVTCCVAYVMLTCCRHS